MPICWRAAVTISTREFDFDPGDDELKRAATREEATELIELWHGRTYETKLPQRNFISPRDQWQSDGDLTDKVSYVRVSLDYDFKRQPIDVVEIDGFLNFTTRPWADIEPSRLRAAIWTAGSKAGARCSRT